MDLFGTLPKSLQSEIHHSRMLGWAMAIFGMGFPLEGRWLGTFEISENETIDFALKFKSNRIRFQGAITAEKNHKFLPKRVDVREVRVNRTFVVFLPGSQIQKFAEFDLAFAEDGILRGNTTSDDQNYRLGLSVLDGEISLALTEQKKRGRTYNYVLTRDSRKGSLLFVGGIAAVVLVLASISLCLCRGIAIELSRGRIKRA
jgi:hypothetical protein